LLTIKVDNLALDYAPPETVTQDNPLLLIHGAGGTSRYWENYLSYFSREGWEVYAINLRGHSPSDREAALAQVTLEDYVEDVEKVIRRRHLERCALIGHSLGGLIAQKNGGGVSASLRSGHDRDRAADGRCDGASPRCSLCRDGS